MIHIISTGAVVLMTCEKDASAQSLIGGASSSHCKRAGGIENNSLAFMTVCISTASTPLLSHQIESLNCYPHIMKRPLQDTTPLMPGWSLAGSTSAASWQMPPPPRAAGSAGRRPQTAALQLPD